MQILRYWKTAEIMPGIKFYIIPEQEITSESSFFDQKLAAVREAAYLDFILIERTEVAADYRDQFAEATAAANAAAANLSNAKLEL